MEPDEIIYTIMSDEKNSTLSSTAQSLSLSMALIINILGCFVGFLCCGGCIFARVLYNLKKKKSTMEVRQRYENDGFYMVKFTPYLYGTPVYKFLSQNEHGVWIGAFFVWVFRVVMFMFWVTTEIVSGHQRDEFWPDALKYLTVISFYVFNVYSTLALLYSTIFLFYYSIEKKFIEDRIQRKVNKVAQVLSRVLQIGSEWNYTASFAVFFGYWVVLQTMSPSDSYTYTSFAKHGISFIFSFAEAVLADTRWTIFDLPIIILFNHTYWLWAIILQESGAVPNSPYGFVMNYRKWFVPNVMYVVSIVVFSFVFCIFWCGYHVKKRVLIENCIYTLSKDYNAKKKRFSDPITFEEEQVELQDILSNDENQDTEGENKNREDQDNDGDKENEDQGQEDQDKEVQDIDGGNQETEDQEKEDQEKEDQEKEDQEKEDQEKEDQEKEDNLGEVVVDEAVDKDTLGEIVLDEAVDQEKDSASVDKENQEVVNSATVDQVVVGGDVDSSNVTNQRVDSVEEIQL